ncbi:MAG: hypothetical protein N3F66_06585 [Spirochaetes bacterium]|nr:hypothetical protein [Spirochaetota bacterium]
MRISDGLSIITLPQTHTKPARTVMVWPVYDDLRITPVKGVARRLENNIQYIKPTPDEHARLLSQVKENPQPLYTGTAHLQKSISVVIPGTFFDAIA